MKLEPFQRGMKELAPTVWITALRKVQNPNRAGLDIVSHDGNFGALKVSPFFYWSDAEMDAYLDAAQAARTSGIISIPPRPTRNASAACTPRGARQAVNAPEVATAIPRSTAHLSSRLMTSYHLDHLQHLETEAIHIMREVAGEFERPALLFSGGKDSICLLRLAEKAFRPSDLPMPLLNVDTGHHFPS